MVERLAIGERFPINQSPVGNIMGAIFWPGDIRENYIGHICAEIFRDGIYEPFLAGRRDLVIMDVGAHVGIFSLYASPYAKVIYAFEPSSEHFMSLLETIKFNNLLDKVKPRRLAIFNENKTFPLFHNKNKTMYSLSTYVDDKSMPPEVVEAVRLDKFFEDEKIEKVDFMKLDIEGSEAEVFGGDGFANVADKIDTIVYELHAWTNRNPNQIKFSLESRGFEIEQIPNETNLWVAKRKK